MLIRFFQFLKQFDVPVTVREHLDFIDLLQQQDGLCDPDTFYLLARTVLVKNEGHFDRFDRACQAFFEGVQQAHHGGDRHALPEDWLRRQLEKTLSEKEREALSRFKDLRELMDALAQRLKEQKKRHQGGNRMVGTGGTSPFGAYGDHPEGVRIGGTSRRSSAVKLWERRAFRNLDCDAQLDTRGLQVALKALRQWARSGPEDKLDLEKTLDSTVRQGGLLDIVWQAERHNAVKIVILFDIGGSMDPYVALCERLFSAVRSEFKHLRFFYFHNMVYEILWRDAARRREDQVPVMDVLHTFSSDYRVIFVGDAAMAPYELLSEGGSLEHWNQEPGKVWLNRLLNHFSKVAWLNPQDPDQWSWSSTTRMIQEQMAGRMYPLTVQGIAEAVKVLR